MLLADTRSYGDKITIANFDDRGIFKNFCSSCFQQKLNPEEVFVDFGSTWDGGTQRSDEGILISIDDLVLCQACLEFAARLIGLEDSNKLNKEIADLKRENKKLLAKVSMAERDLKT